MPTTILRPNGMPVFGPGATANAGGAGSENVAINDNNDATFISLNPGEYYIASFDDFTQPASTAIVSATLRVRARASVVEYGQFVGLVDSSNSPITQFYIVPAVGSAWTTYTLGSVSGLLDADIDGIRVFVNNGTIDFGTTPTFEQSEIYLDILYANPPSVTGTAPSGTVTTTTAPTATWLYTQGTDGGPESSYQVKVFTAAQYGAGGFSPDTSTATYDSGVLSGSATTHQLPSLTNLTTYRMYVRAAQTVASQPHWSSWSFIGFSLNVTTSDVQTVVLTPDNTNARILVTVNRNTGSHAWEYLEVERSVDGGATWISVRGMDYIAVTGNSYAAYDYETGNDQDVKYRARATWISAGQTITGSWTESSTSTGWVSTSVWLKNPLDPTKNLAVTLLLPAPDESFPRRQGVFDVLGAARPVVRSDVLGSARGEISLCSQTLAQADSLLALLQTAVLLLQMPDATSASCPTPSYGWGSKYIAIGGVGKSREGRLVTSAPRAWTFSYVEVDAPADATL